MIFVSLCLTYFTQCDNLWVHLCCSKWHYLILFYSSVILHYRDISHLLEKILESPLDSKEIKPVNPKGNQPWIFIGKANDEVETPILWRNSNTWCEEPTHWKRPWGWERLRAGEGGDRGWDGWMASLTQWTWVWANSRRQWRTGKPGMLQFIGLQIAGHDWVTEQELYVYQVFIHLPVSGCSDYFHDLAIVNSAAVNIGAHASFQIMVFCGSMPRNGID